MKSFWIAEREIKDGILACFDKAKRLLGDAELILKYRGNLSSALGLYIFAVEEFGKGLLLQGCHKNKNGNCEVPISIFGQGGKESHKNKIQKALDKLPTDCRNVSVNIHVKTPVYPQETANTENDARIIEDNLHIRTIDFKKSKKKIIAMPALSSGKFSTVDIETIEDMRWSCFYVDWDDADKYWKYEFQPDEGQLLRAILSLEQF